MSSFFDRWREGEIASERPRGGSGKMREREGGAQGRGNRGAQGRGNREAPSVETTGIKSKIWTRRASERGRI